METGPLNAWHRFEMTGKVEDYLRYCAASESMPSADGMLTETEDGHAAKNKGARSEVPADR